MQSVAGIQRATPWPMPDGGQVTSQMTRAEWAAAANGLFLRVFKYFQSRGHLGIDPAGWALLKSMIPEELAGTDFLAIAVATGQTLSYMPEIHILMHVWNTMARKILVPPEDGPRGLSAALTPWQMEPLWTFSTYGLIVSILMEFAGLDVPGKQEEFLATLTGEEFSFGNNRKTTEKVVAVLWFLLKSSWAWPAVFRQQIATPPTPVVN